MEFDQVEEALTARHGDQDEKDSIHGFRRDDFRRAHDERKDNLTAERMEDYSYNAAENSMRYLAQSLLGRSELRSFSVSPVFLLGGLVVFPRGEGFIAFLAHLSCFLYIASFSIYLANDIYEEHVWGDVYTFNSSSSRKFSDVDVVDWRDKPKIEGPWQQHRSEALFALQLSISCILFCGNIMNIYSLLLTAWDGASKRKSTKHIFAATLRHLLDPYVFIDVVLFSMLWLPVGNWSKYKWIWTPTFLHVWHAKRSFMTILLGRLDAQSSGNASLTLYNVFEIGLGLFCFIFTWSCILEQLAIDVEVPDDDEPSPTRLNFLEAIYFVVVSFTTTGYGDFSPTTNFGYFIVTIFLLTSVTLIGRRVSTVVSTIQSIRESGGRYYPDAWVQSHIVVSGGNLRPEHLNDFLLEILVQCGRWGNKTETPFIVVISSLESRSLPSAFENVRWKDRVKFLHGTVMDPNCLERARVQEAQAVFLLADRMSTDMEITDAETVLRAWSVNGYAPHVKQFVQILLTENEAQFTSSDNITVIPVYDLHNALLSATCTIPGASTLITELAHGTHSPSIQRWIDQGYLILQERETFVQNSATLSANRRREELRLIESQKYQLSAAFIYVSTCLNSLFCVELSQDPAGKSPHLLKYIGKDFAFSVFDALRYGICIIGVRLKDGPRSKPERVLRPGQVVLNPIRTLSDGSCTKFILEEGDLVFYLAKARDERLTTFQSNTGLRRHWGRSRPSPHHGGGDLEGKQYQEVFDYFRLESHGSVSSSVFHENETNEESVSLHKLDVTQGSSGGILCWLRSDAMRPDNKLSGFMSPMGSIPSINTTEILDEWSDHVAAHSQYGPFIVIDAFNCASVDPTCYMLVRQLYRVQNSNEPNFSPLVIALSEDPGAEFRSFLGKFPYAYFYVGRLSGAKSKAMNKVLKHAKVVLSLPDGHSRDPARKLQIQSDESMLRDALSMTLMGRMAAKAPDARLVSDLKFRSNYKYVGYELVKHDSFISENEPLNYVYGKSYQSGTVCSDTLVDIILAQAFFSNQGREMVQIYKQLLGIDINSRLSDKSQADDSPSSSALEAWVMSTDIIEEIRAHCPQSRRSENSEFQFVTYHEACWYALEVMGAIPVGVYGDYNQYNKSEQLFGNNKQFVDLDDKLTLCNPPLNTRIYAADLIYIIQPPQLSDNVDKELVYNKSPMPKGASQVAQTSEV
eukprot:m.160867 g.160867  ORF g.160867 m.160867 type:complete len:1199 (+) comp15177_c0_seq1:247-3843(+)